MKPLVIAVGNFLFKYRNYVFPLYILGLFLLFGSPVRALHGSELAGQIRDAAALMIALSGLAVRGIVIGLAYIKRGGLNKKVYADNLVTEGMFAICRNPLYVGNMLIYTGEFLLFGDPWCFVIGVLSFWLAYECIIATEENYLRDKFGPAYDDYCRDVPRWWIMWSKFGGATVGMTFDWKKVLFKDYSTMHSTLLVLACIQAWKLYVHGGFQSHARELIGLTAAVVFFTLAAVVVRVMKKSTPPAAA